MSENAHCAHWDTPLSFYPFCYFYLSQVKWDFLKQTEITICAPIFHLVPSFERERALETILFICSGQQKPVHILIVVSSISPKSRFFFF